MSPAQVCGCDPEARHQCAAHESGYYKTCEPTGAADTKPCSQGPTSYVLSPNIQAEYRKTFPVATGLIDFFPDALLEVAHVSWAGTQQHHPDQPLHWDRSKSTDEADALLRHFIQRGTLDTDGIRHSAKVAWRSLSLLQRELEQEGK